MTLDEIKDNVFENIKTLIEDNQTNRNGKFIKTFVSNDLLTSITDVIGEDTFYVVNTQETPNTLSTLEPFAEDLTAYWYNKDKMYQIEFSTQEITFHGYLQEEEETPTLTELGTITFYKYTILWDDNTNTVMYCYTPDFNRVFFNTLFNL